MHVLFCAILFYLCCYGEARLWSKGVVHYAINSKDYDLHSQDIIVSTLKKLESEICVKFFSTPFNHTLADDARILYVSNPDKRKDCPPEDYSFDKTVVDIHIGYKCLNDDDISRKIMEMLRASIGDKDYKPNSVDLYKTFQAVKKKDLRTNSLLMPSDRDLINTYYLQECGELTQKPISGRRWYAGKTMELNSDNEKFYNDKLWPFGIVMYDFDKKSTASDIKKLEDAMKVIEHASCIVFQRISEDRALQPRNLLYFGAQGEAVPNLGFIEGNQSVLLSSMLTGAPGHSAHTLSLLMRVLGIPMMSNRYDRSSHIQVNWNNVARMNEHYLERLPKEAWVRDIEGEGTAYDFDSVTHAPANYMCTDCSRGQQTVTPIQDYLWQRTLSMGHRTDLSPADMEMLSLLYSKYCQVRFVKNAKK
ncbi:hypothetical protein PYW08_012155 [Mythimna loreyi]|uniref:Uncharacterized protein n=1 Tax=Mythimna loreyi TaxID=667449 RepID=A0ACC2Q1T1_9NEOP|nr:hypothetical protein PYW08_012155 [Mythimna loreyi]